MNKIKIILLLLACGTIWSQCDAAAVNKEFTILEIRKTPEGNYKYIGTIPKFEHKLSVTTPTLLLKNNNVPVTINDTIVIDINQPNVTVFTEEKETSNNGETVTIVERYRPTPFFFPGLSIGFGFGRGYGWGWPRHRGYRRGWGRRRRW